MATEKKDPPDPVAELPQYDVMSAAFDEIMQPDSTELVNDDPPDKKESTPAAKADGTLATPPEKKDPAAKVEGAVEDPPKKEGAEDAVTDPPKKEGTDAEGDEDDKTDWKAEHEKLVAANKKRDEEAATAVTAKETKDDEAATEAAAKKPAPEVYSAEEKTFLDGYEKEWPDIVKGEALRRRAEYGQIIKHVFTEIHKAYGPLIERGVVAADNVAESNTLQFIRQTHTDYNDAMYDDLVVWAEGLTGYRQKLAKSTIEDGEPQDLVDLIAEFKTVTGRNKPKAVAGESDASKVTELSPQAKKAAKAIGVVDTKRTAAAPNAADPNDFDGGWAEAIGTSK